MQNQGIIQRGRMCLLAAVMVAMAACQDGGAITEKAIDPTPARMDIVAGQSQTGGVGEELPDPLVVKVVNASGDPVAKQIVNFHVVSGGGSVFAGTALTNTDGIAQERWTLGPKAGVEQKVEARAVDSGTGEKQVFATFTATALDPANVIATVKVSPDSASLLVGGTQQLTATARNASGTALSGKTFTWSSSDSSVATVSASGAVTAKANGTATITAASEGQSDEAKITVKAPVSAGSGSTSAPVAVGECASPKSGWIFCDDFEQNRLAKYFEYDSQNGAFSRVASTGVEGSTAMRARFAKGQTNAGSLKLAFGKTPDPYFKPADAGTKNYREVYFRFYLKNAANWKGGGGDKLTRAISFAKSDWSEAMIAHVWSGGNSTNNNYLLAEPVSGTDAQGNVVTSGYNDMDHMRWLGSKTGKTPIFDASHVGQWYCVETHVRLNDAGQNNGVFEYWINDGLEARTTGLNWVGSFSAYGINSVFLENYWNNGSPQQQDRFFDNFVVSTQRIGCDGNAPTGGSTPPPPPPPAAVTSVTVSPKTVTLTTGASAKVSAAAKDANGTTVTGKTVVWTSSKPSVASVNSSGSVTALAAGTATIKATVDGVSGQAAVSVTAPVATTPPPPSSSVAPALTEDFSTYTSTSNLLSDPRGIYVSSENINTKQITLDTSVGYGGSGKSMRYDYPRMGAVSADYTISRSLNLRSVGATEVWVEAAVRFSSNFSLNAGTSAGAALKLLHVAEPDVPGRFGLNFENGDNGSLNAEGPNDTYDAMYLRGSVRPNSLFDGNWHVVRYHIRLGSSDFHEFWVDGAYQGSRTGSTSARSFSWISLAKNLNQGPLEAQSLWWGSVKVWKTNPGW